MGDGFGGIRLVGGANGGDVERLRLAGAACGGVGTTGIETGVGTGNGAVNWTWEHSVLLDVGTGF